MAAKSSDKAAVLGSRTEPQLTRPPSAPTGERIERLNSVIHASLPSPSSLDAGLGDPPEFDTAFRSAFETLVRWRRDVRRFRRDPVPEALLEHLLDLAQLSPSVGNSQPWRWVRVESPGSRTAVLSNFRRCNADALASLDGERASLYARLKLEGLEAAPIQLAVFCDHATGQGHGLGCRTMPHALDHSVASMLSVLWLASRAFGLGMGWVSILDADELARQLDVPAEWSLVAYLCLGWPLEQHLDPDLERAGWQKREPTSRAVLVR